jgi:protein SCO1
MEKIKTLCMCLVSFVLLAAGCSEQPTIEEIEKGFPMSLKVEDFEGVNQAGTTITNKDVDGQVWLASFIFTNCDTVCSPMTATTSRLQAELEKRNIDVTFLSFSIDPEHDTPEVLKEFGQRVDADFSNWHFLTGYEQETIESFANISFLSPAAKIEGSNQFMHSTSLYLVNQRGTVLQQYDAVTDIPIDQIATDIKKLRNQN